MTPQYPTGGSGRRRLTAPRQDESVPRAADPPIYRDLLRHWASAGRTLPGRRDQEWNRLTAAPAWTQRTGWVSGTLAQRGDGR
ncbi:hypothetical protein [Streptomyces formicae]|uniref:Uncharacterized protein n=1 Tax=Streptomyces formicae TaxID=1616117 RepID=A0ABY3WQR9_9ACTN|nr:hypothetical protein [Streptomyces formicae]UNM13931.1 hypothetical protein J4032_22890 [Streptomyces formicae]